MTTTSAEAIAVAAATSDGLARDRLLAQALEVSADAIFCQDGYGRLLTWNAAAERTYGYKEVDVVGRLANDVLPARTWQELQDSRQTALSGQRVERFDSWHERKDGSLVPVDVSAAPLRGDDDTVLGVVTTVADITDRNRMARDLERAGVRLERRNAALLRSNRDLEQFAYVASHDLSEPLRVITGYIGRIEHRFSDVLDERGQRYMQHIVEASTRMRSLIDDLLDYSRFLRAPRGTSVLDTDAALATVLGALDRQLQEAGATVTTSHLPPVCSDATLLESLLTNLISNACKFRSPDRPPHVDIHGSETDGQVTLVVDDNGIGIDVAYRERVFRMFQRLHVREAYPGTGIGLAIAQQIVEAQDGRIWIEDSPLGGTRFCFTLPGRPLCEDDDDA
jgi:PAS domain S-box-containing protein